MRDDHIDLCGQVDFTRTEAAASGAGGAVLFCLRRMRRLLPGQGRYRIIWL